MPPKPEIMNRITTTEVPTTLQQRFEYNTNRTMKYTGFAERGKATSDENWLIHAFSYSTLNQATLRQSACGAWDDRGDLEYA